jgi:hypothetical protein
MEEQLYSFFHLGARWGKWWTLHARPIVWKAGCTPGPIWMGAQNLSSTRIRSPDRPERSETLYWLIYHGSRNIPEDINCWQPQILKSWIEYNFAANEVITNKEQNLLANERVSFSGQKFGMLQGLRGGFQKMQRSVYLFLPCNKDVSGLLVGPIFKGQKE